MKNIALALGQIEEAMGLIEDPPFLYPEAAYQALVRARDFLAEASAADVARVPVAHYTPITPPIAETGP